MDVEMTYTKQENGIYLYKSGWYELEVLLSGQRASSPVSFSGERRPHGETRHGLPKWKHLSYFCPVREVANLSSCSFRTESAKICL